MSSKFFINNNNNNDDDNNGNYTISRYSPSSDSFKPYNSSLELKGENEKRENENMENQNSQIQNESNTPLIKRRGNFSKGRETLQRKRRMDECRSKRSKISRSLSESENLILDDQFHEIKHRIENCKREIVSLKQEKQAIKKRLQILEDHMNNKSLSD